VGTALEAARNADFGSHIAIELGGRNEVHGESGGLLCSDVPTKHLWRIRSERIGRRGKGAEK
jgi:hypothetical protein